MYARSDSFHGTRVPGIQIPRYCRGLLVFAEGFIFFFLNLLIWLLPGLPGNLEEGALLSGAIR